MADLPTPDGRSIARAVLGLLAFGGLILAGPSLPRPLGAVVAAHSQLVSSVPGAGETVATAPTALRLEFSESIAPPYTSFDLLDGTGRTLLLAAGTVDPADDRGLVAPLPPLPPDTYTVQWRSLSADDGHVEEGAYTFAVLAPGASPPGAGPAGILPSQAGGTIHSGHDATQAAVEVQGKVLAYGGTMLAFGLPLVAWFVLRPALGGRVPRAFVLGVGVSQIASALGVGLLIVVGVASLPATGGATGAPDSGAFLFGTRPGLLLVGRLVLAVLAGVLALVAARLGRPGLALTLAGGPAAIAIALIAISGHALAFDTPLPVVVDIVHVGAAATWLSGIVSLAVLSDFGGRFDPPTLRAVVPGYSAMAVVSIGLASVTGIYADWAQTGELVSTASGYATNLDVKIALVLAALLIGGLNFLDGGTDRRWLGGISRRILVETVLAVGVIVVTANLTSGSPAREDRPVAIAAAPSTAAETAIDFAVQPGRPGPNRFIAASGGTPTPAGSAVTLVLQRLDSGLGPTRIPLHAVSGTDGRFSYVADGGMLIADSRWDATVTVADAAGTEIGRRHFTFAVDALGIAAGRAVPPIDPGLAMGLLLAAGGLFGLAFGLAGGSIPRTPPAWSRRVLVTGSAVGTALGTAILVGGPVR